MTTWVCVTRTVYRGVKVRLHTRASACLTLSAICQRVRDCRDLPDEAYWSRFGTVASVISRVCVCVCVLAAEGLIGWPSLALCEATSPPSLWGWLADTQSCPGVTASSQQHNWLTLLNFSAAFPVHEVSFIFTKVMGTTEQSHPFYFYAFFPLP